VLFSIFLNYLLILMKEVFDLWKVMRRKSASAWWGRKRVFCLRECESSQPWPSSSFSGVSLPPPSPSVLPFPSLFFPLPSVSLSLSLRRLHDDAFLSTVLLHAPVVVEMDVRGCNPRSSCSFSSFSPSWRPLSSSCGGCGCGCSLFLFLILVAPRARERTCN